MAIVSAYAVPHPPVIVPCVGQGREAEIADTTAAFQEVAARIAADAPDLLVVASPHAPLFRDGFFVSLHPAEEGSMEAFGQPQAVIRTHNDLPFAEALAARAQHHGLPVAPAPAAMEALDHGAFVPLHFIGQQVDLGQVPVVRLGLSGLGPLQHRQLGRCLAAVASEQDKRVVLVASGDWSHKLREDGPYGYVPEGPAFDRELCGIFQRGTLEDLFTLDEGLCDRAAECGLRSFQIMAGALEGSAFESELLSYQGPFGVGYGVAALKVLNGPGSTADEAAAEEARHGSDPLVALARDTVEAYVTTGFAPEVPASMAPEYLHRKAGAFVSLHERGRLRGCIGTIAPARDSIAQEVIANAVAACSADPRFPPVRPDELDYLSYSVDVLGQPEPVESLVQLDPRTYGVIVSRGHRRGLLLPDLEGVDTVADQIAIARQKAGIAPDEDVRLERFEVIRHSAGGGARRG